MADSSNGNLPAATNSGEPSPPSTPSPYHGGPAQPGMVPYQAGGMLPQRRGMRGFEPPIEDEEGVPWSRYIAALHRYKWLILLLTVLGTGAGAVVSRFIAPAYEANATIWVETNPVMGGVIRPRELLQSGAWVELLLTGAVLDSVALKLRLYAIPNFPADSSLFQTFAVTSATGPVTISCASTPAGTVLPRTPSPPLSRLLPPLLPRLPSQPRCHRRRNRQGSRVCLNRPERTCDSLPRLRCCLVS